MMNSVSLSTLLVKETGLPAPDTHSHSKVHFQLKDRPTSSKNFLLGS